MSKHDPLRLDSEMPHLAIAHTHLNWIMDQTAHGTGDDESPLAFHFTDKHMPDLLFVLVHVIMSIAEDESGSQRDRIPPALRGIVRLDPDDERSQRLLGLLAEIGIPPSDVFSNVEPVYPEGQRG